jgi:hypothetical protein
MNFRTAAGSNNRVQVVGDPVKRYKRQKCTLYAAIGLALFAAYVLWNLYFLVVHYHEKLAMFRDQLSVQKHNGELQWQESCINKPPQYVTELLNCTKAYEWKSIQVDEQARYKALHHIQQYDISFRGLVLGCHGLEPCKTYLARLLDAIIDNIPLMLWTILVASVAVILIVFLPGVAFWKTFKLKRQNDQNMRLTKAGTNNVAVRELVDMAKDTDDYAKLLQSAALQQKVQQAADEYKQRAKDTTQVPLQLYFGSGEQVEGHNETGTIPFMNWSQAPMLTDNPPPFPMDSGTKTFEPGYNGRV